MQSNFVKWEFDVPREVSGDAEKYCVEVSIPRPRSSNAILFDVAGVAMKTQPLANRLLIYICMYQSIINIYLYNIFFIVVSLLVRKSLFFRRII